MLYKTKSKGSNTQLVVWGANLGYTTLLYRELIKEISDSTVIPPYQYSIFVGLLLSNGWLSMPYSGSRKPNARFGLQLPYSQIEYIWPVFNGISFYC